jgi:hypothetical protein
MTHQSPELRRRKGWASWLTVPGALWHLAILVAVVFAYHVPLDVLDRYPQAKEFVDFMASWHPQIRCIGEVGGPAVQANRFIYSVMWCFMPFVLLMLVYHGYKEGKPRNFVIQAKSWAHFAAIAFLIFLFTYGIIFSLHGDMSSRFGKAVFVFDLSRSILGPAIVTASTVLLFISMYFVWAFLTRRVITIRDAHA